MQKFLLAEFLIGGGVPEAEWLETPESIRHEAAGMLHTLASHFSVQYANTELLIPVAPFAIDEVDLPHTVTVINSPHGASGWLVDHLDTSPALLIAPECDGCLQESVRNARQTCSRLWNASDDFTAMASDKWLSAKWLAKSNIPHVETISRGKAGCWSDSFGNPREIPSQVIVKPRLGCGGMGIEKISASDLETWISNNDIFWEHHVIQPRVDGPFYSRMAFLGPQRVHLFPPTIQKRSQDGFAYRGGHFVSEEQIVQQLDRLTQQVLHTIDDESLGFIGIDFAYRQEPSRYEVIEINPRLTTSFVGVGTQLQGMTPNELLFDPAPMEPLASRKWLDWPCSKPSIIWDHRGVINER